MFNNKILLITGGTGSFNAVLNKFLDTGIKEIRIFSLMRKSNMICVFSIIIKN